MNAKRLYLLLIGALALTLIGLAGATYGISQAMQKQSVDLAADKANVESLSNQQTGLAKAKQDVKRYASLEQITKAIVPQDKDQAQTVLELTKIANANNINLTAISFPSSNLGAASVSSGAATSSTSSSAAAAAKATTSLSQLTPVKGLAGVYNLQITIGNNTGNTVTFSQLESFLHDLENNRRTAAVGSLDIKPQAGKADSLVFTLVINTYIKP